jgi:hypothetical protein
VRQATDSRRVRDSNGKQAVVHWPTSKAQA